jgi:hypothetical protein
MMITQGRFMRVILRVQARATRTNRAPVASEKRKFFQARGARFCARERRARVSICPYTNAFFLMCARSRAARAAHKRRAEKMSRMTKNR